MDLSPLATVHRFLECSARACPDRIAFIQEGERWSYGHINGLANRLAGWLLDRGVAPGDRVVLLLENGLQYVVSYYGVLKAGGVAVPLNTVRLEGLAPVLAELAPRAVIAGAGCEDVLLELDALGLKIPLLVIKDPRRPAGSGASRTFSWDEIVGGGDAADPSLEMESTSLASIIYTSGSTGKPKGVMLTHGNIVANTQAIVQYLQLTGQDVQMVVLPFFHVTGKSLLNTHFAVGGTVVVNNGLANPASVIQQMVAEKVTGFSGLPATYAYLLHRFPLHSFRDKLSSLRYCTQAGGHMSRQIKEKLLQTLPAHTSLYLMYGATEAAARLTYMEPELLKSKIASIGKPVAGVTIRVLDEQGRELPVGQVGELVAAGPNITQGYWMDAAATARALDANGYHTGDLGYRDEEGCLYLTGRKDDVLEVGGHRIDAQEVEEALMATGLLLEVAVLGVEDGLAGKRLVAVATPLSGETSAGNILALAVSKLPRHKLPARIKLVKSLPTCPSGKIDRTACLAIFSGESFG